MLNKSFQPAIGFLALWALAPTAAAQCEYELTEIESPLDCGLFDVDVSPQGINDQGQVVGYTKCSVSSYEKAFIWSKEEGMTLLDTPPSTTQSWANDINNKGQICGSYQSEKNPSFTAYIIDGDEFIDLGPHPDGDYSIAYAINDSGHVTGVWGDFSGSFDAPPSEAFVYMNDKMFGLNKALNIPFSYGEDINNFGQVTGRMTTDGSLDMTAYIWFPSAAIDLGVPEMEYAFGTRSEQINEHGDVAGRVGLQFDDGEITTEGFVYIDGEFHVTGELLDTPWNAFMAINDHRQAVGDANGPETPSHAILWQHGQVHDLNDLIVNPESAYPTIRFTTDINNSGQIIGEGYGVGMVLTPINVPTHDLDIDCTVGVSDLLALLEHWGTDDDAADFNDDGIVHVLDLLELLSNWRQ